MELEEICQTVVKQAIPGPFFWVRLQTVVKGMPCSDCGFICKGIVTDRQTLHVHKVRVKQSSLKPADARATQRRRFQRFTVFTLFLRLKTNKQTDKQKTSYLLLLLPG